MSTSAVRRLSALAAARGGPGAEPVVLAQRPDGTVVRSGSVAAKAHAPDADPAQLALRLRVAAHPLLHRVLLTPLACTGPGPDGLLGALPDGRPMTLWPYGTPVAPDAPESAPWAEAGTLLARLHTVPVAALPGPLPPMRGPTKAARAMTRMRRSGAGGTAAAGVVERAWARLPAWARGRAVPPRTGNTLCHGDLHLGQLVRHPAPDGPWQLIDIDDLGLGDPAWDLARPAAWFAAGLLPPADWDRFLGAYRAAGGTAVPAGRGQDPWPRLDVPARALTVQITAVAVAGAAAAGRELDEVERAMADACYRIAELPPDQGP
ncbi:aminoglycoside phosphotransferase family protein [Streptomyces gobiensis]|uniref:phosphotransferase n=1 Tax=Streptomyces gobiensis TaxID=2875706 RepID=UPI001E3C5FEF|nr:aminoglycoside phosphotransferase family protein [Streptomyces gobiensis]UGY90423.1 aminoglycoside phosphotransferase family protein [Streptomyces gobiensis]